MFARVMTPTHTQNWLHRARLRILGYAHATPQALEWASQLETSGLVQPTETRRRQFVLSALHLGLLNDLVTPTAGHDLIRKAVVAYHVLKSYGRPVSQAQAKWADEVTLKYCLDEDVDFQRAVAVARWNSRSGRLARSLNSLRHRSAKKLRRRPRPQDRHATSRAVRRFDKEDLRQAIDLRLLPPPKCVANGSQAERAALAQSQELADWLRLARDNVSTPAQEQWRSELAASGCMEESRSQTWLRDVLTSELLPRSLWRRTDGLDASAGVRGGDIGGRGCGLARWCGAVGACSSMWTFAAHDELSPPGNDPRRLTASLILALLAPSSPVITAFGSRAGRAQHVAVEAPNSDSMIKRTPFALAMTDGAVLSKLHGTFRAAVAW